MLKNASPKISNFFSQIFTIYYDFAMNFMEIKIKDVQPIFRRKSICGTYTAHHE